MILRPFKCPSWEDQGWCLTSNGYLSLSISLFLTLISKAYLERVSDATWRCNHLPDFTAEQERQSRCSDQRPVCGEHSAAEGSGDNGAATEAHREEELPAGGENMQSQQNSAGLESDTAFVSALSLQELIIVCWNKHREREDILSSPK